MNTNLMPCGLDDERIRFEPDGPELVAPVWIKSEQCAVERSAKADAAGLCRVWASWRESHDLLLMLHGFLMITGLRDCDAAWREIDFLVDMLNAEEGQ